MDTVEEIKKKLDIADFLGEYLTLKKAGRNFKANCPFHHEKTPSFVISPDRQIWYCFGACHEGGDIFKFLMKIENITFSEALKELAQKTGVTIQSNAIEDKEWKKKEVLFEINNLAAQYYHFLLTKHKIGEKALEYIKNREINDKIIETFLIGYSPNAWSSLLEFLQKKGFKTEDILRTGLIVKSPKGTYYDRFRKRIIFPLKDQRGNIIGFSGRILENIDDAKYVNIPETELYHKRETLYGIHLTKDEIRKSGTVIIVEGEFDFLSLYQHGIANVVAIKGSALTIEQLKLLKRYCNKIIIATDNDSSGADTITRTVHEAELLDFEITVIRFDYAKDPDEAVKKDLIAFKKLVQKPIPVYDFIIENAAKNNPEKDAFSKKKMGEEVIPYIQNISNPIVKEYYIKKLAETLDVDIESIIELMKRKEKILKNPVLENKPLPKKEVNRYEILQQYLLSMLFHEENPFTFYKQLLKIIETNDFSVPSYNKLFNAFLIYENNVDIKGNFAIKSFIETLPSELLPAFDELLLFDIELFDGLEVKELDKLVYEFKRLSLRRQIKDIMEGEEQEKLPELTKLLSDIEKKLSIL